MREAHEETGINGDDLTVLTTFIDDHDGWNYTTVIAIASNTLDAHQLNEESHEVRWVKFDDVTRLNLHPSFASTWDSLRLAVEDAIERAM